MILSFSIPNMRPYIEAGIRQAKGEHVSERVKRQTIRELKPGGRYEHLLNNLKYIEPVDLHIWWKSRTPEREKLGTVRLLSVERIIIRNQGGILQVCREAYPPGPMSDYGIVRLARADGFNGTVRFADFFVPNPGDVFNGVLIKW